MHKGPWSTGPCEGPALHRIYGERRCILVSPADVVHQLVRDSKNPELIQQTMELIRQKQKSIKNMECI